ncbi:RNA polymerase sigma-70 factor [Bacteroidota bacterium]
MEKNEVTNELVLINEIKSGNEIAFEYIFKKYYKPLCLFSRKIVHNPHNAEEVVSNVFMRLWEHRSNICITRCLSSYLFRAIYNESLNYLNAFSKRQIPIDSNHIYYENYEGEISLLSHIYATELKYKINTCVKSLPRKCQEIFSLSRNIGFTHKEIAERMCISVRTVEHQIGNALERLREIIQSDQ